MMKEKTKEQLVNSFTILKKKLTTKSIISIIFVVYISAFIIFQAYYFHYWGEFSSDNLFSLFIVVFIWAVWNLSLSRSIGNIFDILLGILNEQEDEYHKIITDIEREAPNLESAISYFKNHIQDGE